MGQSGAGPVPGKECGPCPEPLVQEGSGAGPEKSKACGSQGFRAVWTVECVTEEGKEETKIITSLLCTRLSPCEKGSVSLPFYRCANQGSAGAWSAQGWIRKTQGGISEPAGPAWLDTGWHVRQPETPPRGQCRALVAPALGRARCPALTAAAPSIPSHQGSQENPSHVLTHP